MNVCFVFCLSILSRILGNAEKTPAYLKKKPITNRILSSVLNSLFAITGQTLEHDDELCPVLYYLYVLLNCVYQRGGVSLDGD